MHGNIFFHITDSSVDDFHGFEVLTTKDVLATACGATMVYIWCMGFWLPADFGRNYCGSYFTAHLLMPMMMMVLLDEEDIIRKLIYLYKAYIPL